MCGFTFTQQAILSSLCSYYLILFTRLVKKRSTKIVRTKKHSDTRDTGMDEVDTVQILQEFTVQNGSELCENGEAGLECGGLERGRHVVALR